MGWNLNKQSKGWLVGAASTLLMTGLFASQAGAQLPIDIVTLQNQNLALTLGRSLLYSGSIQVDTTASNPTDPGNNLLDGSPIEAPNAVLVPTFGSHLYVRVDGGRGHGGYDYIFGRVTNLNPSLSGFGQWLFSPTVIGSHLVAKWQAVRTSLDGNTSYPTGLGNILIPNYDPKIEIDLFATIVHDQVRFEFKVTNNSDARQHDVALAFTQDASIFLARANGLRTPGSSYFRTETLFSGASIPQTWESIALNSKKDGTFGSLRGILKPSNTGQSEPTPPTRFALGWVNTLNGAELNVFNTSYAGRNFDLIWNFNDNKKRRVIGKNTTFLPGLITYWDAQALGAGQSKTYVTFVGQATSEIDTGRPMTLAVSAPKALGYSITKDANGNPIGCAASPSSSFSVDAFVQNLTDVGDLDGVPIGPVSLFLDLPKGLILATGETNPKTVVDLPAGGEGSASWKVMLDPANMTSGNLRFTVTASPNLGTGKSVQRTIEVPLPSTVTLKNSASTQGLYSMLSFPYLFGNTPPSTILGLNANSPAPDFDLVRWNPTTGHYEPVNTFTPGLGYWFRSRLAIDKTVSIDCTKYPAIASQVQPTDTTYSVNYPRGWNQIANPYIYGVRFSEVEVFDTLTSVQLTADVAADPFHQWILGAVFRYDTSDSNPQNWQYVIEDNLGFTMKPYEGYWILVKKANLRFVYPGVDTPGASVTRQVLAGAGLGIRRSAPASSNNWRLQLNARGTVSIDTATYIGVNSKATDVLDAFKLPKPPAQDKQVSMDIVHEDWTEPGRYAMDLRSASPGRKTWDMVLTSSIPNEKVAVSWPDFAASVPKSYRLTLVDVDSNQRYDLRTSASVSLITNQDKTRKVQIIAESVRGNAPAFITSFDVVANRSRGTETSSVAINYALTETAETRVYIRSGNGRSVRTLVGTTVGRAVGDNSGTIVWDLRDDRGAAIPAGTYNVELVAKGTNGQPFRQIKPFLLTR